MRSASYRKILRRKKNAEAFSPLTLELDRRAHDRATRAQSFLEVFRQSF